MDQPSQISTSSLPIVMFFAAGDCKDSQPSSSSSTSALQGIQPCRHFDFHEILLATDEFDESLIIGHGGFGKVYKGYVSNGSNPVVAAIKRLDSMSDQGATEFWAEVEMLSKLRHCNLVSLIGYCNYEKEMILVYEYVPNGTLEDNLHKLGTPLSWLQRLNICIGAARGLHYLHTGTGIQVGVTHRDVKSSNILLDEIWAARISDFGLSRISPTNQPSTYVKTDVKGTFGYLDPHYYATGMLTRKSDVYAFGVVLLEVLCRKRAVDGTLDEEQWSLVQWAQDSIKEGKLKHIIDFDIRDQISPKCLKGFVRVIGRCLHNNPKQRSTMAGVVVSLESLLAVQEKFNNSLQHAGKTIFGRMVDMLPFPPNGEISAQGDPKQSSNTHGNGSGVSNSHNSLKEFKFADLKRATGNFSQKQRFDIASFGRVFLGWIDKNTFAPSARGFGIAVAVKRISQYNSQGVAGWQTEVSLLGRLVHPNIVTLLGYCNDENREYLLVYEYMHNQSFDSFLFTNGTEIPKPLSWGTRVNIMIGVARGLAYLHSSEPQVILRHLNSSNIFLDQDFNAKLGDFALARLSPEIGETHSSTRNAGTFGYLAPEYMLTGRLTVKNDIYNFGVVMLETLTGRRPWDPNRPYDELILVTWTTPFLAKRKTLEKIMDQRLEQNYPLEAVLKYAELTLRCLANNPKDRPSSEEVLQSLEQIYDITSMDTPPEGLG